MSLQAMTNAVGKVLTQANRGMTLIQISEQILIEISAQGYELKATIDTGLSPMKQGAIELHEIFVTLMDQGFDRAEAFTLVGKIFDNQLDSWRERN